MSSLSCEARVRLADLIEVLNPLARAVARTHGLTDDAVQTSTGELISACDSCRGEELPRRRSARGRDLRLPKPGTLLRRTYEHREIIVRVLNHGFEHDGRHYRSLSAIAKQLTGAHWNGLLFFGLVTQEK